MDEAKKWFWVLLDIFIATLVINAIFFMMPMFQNLGKGLYPARTITVSAEGKTTVSPDLAEVSFSVISQGQNPETLATDNNDKMSAVIRFVKSQGIDEKNIKTTNYNLRPNYRYDKDARRNDITGYTLTQTVLVKVRNLSKVASVIGGLAPLGVNQIGGINFTFDNPEKFLAAARADAFVKVAAKAREMASGAGVSLGKIVNVSEYGTPWPRPLYMGGIGRAVGGGEVSPPPLPPTIEPGTQDITASVTITYELR